MRRADCQIHEMKKCSEAVLRMAEKITDNQKEIFEGGRALWHQVNEVTAIANDFNLLYLLKGDIKKQNSYSTQLEEIQKTSKKFKSQVELSQKETLELVQFIKEHQQKVLQLSNDHLCDTMVSAQQKYLFQTIISDDYLPASGFIPVQQVERTVTMTETSKMVFKKQERGLFSPSGSDSSLKLLPQ